MSYSKPIIVGIDFSKASPNVLKHAAGIAKAEGAPLIVVHVVDASKMSHWLSGRKDASEIEQLCALAKDKVTKLIEEEPAAADAEIIVRSGRPSVEMQAVIDEKEAGLLVIAANDYTKKRLGLTASRCVRMAHCDVLVLRDWQEGKFCRVLAAVDMSPSSKAVLEQATEVAVSCGAFLQIVNVIFPPGRDPGGDALESTGTDESFVEKARAKAQHALENFLSPFEERLASIPHEATVLEATDPAAKLTYYAEGGGFDLVVLGTRGHSKLGAKFLGTNTEKLLQDVPLSVLAVRV